MVATVHVVRPLRKPDSSAALHANHLGMANHDRRHMDEPARIGSMTGMFLMMWKSNGSRKWMRGKSLHAGSDHGNHLFHLRKDECKFGDTGPCGTAVLPGLAMSLAFVPLTTLTMAFVKLENIPYATSLFSTLRNIGSSMGISFVATYIERRKTIPSRKAVRAYVC